MGENSYSITGKLCLPKLPMDNIASCDWNMLEAALLESLFSEASVQEKRTSSSTSLCALSLQASVVLSSKGLSHSSVVGMPYFFCNFCDHHTDSKAQLLQHLTTKHVFKCRLCTFISVTRFELVQHLIRKHQDTQEMQSVLDSKILQMNLSLIQRNLQHFSQFLNDSRNSVTSYGTVEGSASLNHSRNSVTSDWTMEGSASLNHSRNSVTSNRTMEGSANLNHSRNSITSVRTKEGSVSSNHSRNSVTSGRTVEGSASLNHSRNSVTSIRTKEESVSSNHSRNSVTSGRTVKGLANSCHLSHIKDFHPGHRTTQLKEGNSNMSASSKHTFDTCEPPEESKWDILTDSHSMDKVSKRCHSLDAHLEENGSYAKRSRLGCDTHGQEREEHTSHNTSVLPHFLNESDSNVTDSCSTKTTTSPRYFERDDYEKATEINFSRNQAEPHDADVVCQTPPCLTESQFSRDSMENAKPDEGSDNNPSYKLSTVRKILQCFDKCESKTCSSVLCSLITSDSRSEFFSTGSSASAGGSDRSAYDTRERISNSKVLSLSEARFEKEQNVAKSPGFSFLDFNTDASFVARHEVQNKPSEYSSLSLNSEMSLGSVNCIKSVNSVTCEGSREKSCVLLKSTQDVENFLMPSGDLEKLDSSSKRFQSCSTQQDSFSGNKDEQHSNKLPTNMDDGKRYDILRRLLVGSVVATDISKQQTEATGPHDSFHTSDIDQNDKDEHGPTLAVTRAPNMSQHVITASDLSQHDLFPSMTRASDMSLKDLLTRSIPASNVTPSVFLVCGYCNFESSNKAEFQKHVKQCERVSRRPVTEAHAFDKQLSCQVKTEPPECSPEEITFSSGKLPASDVLKGLSKHYSESLGLNSEVNAHSKPHVTESELLISETCVQSTDRICSPGKTVLEASEIEVQDNRCLKHQSSRKKADLDCVYESGENTCNSDSDSDCMLTSYIGSRKKHRQRVRQGLTDKGTSDFSEKWVPQPVGLNCLSKQHEEVHLSCLYCSFSTHDRTNMRQHLLENHPDCASFSKTVVGPHEKSLLYLCTGVHSQCNFTSTEGSEIFEHIKFCYSGHLDNFTPCDGQESQDYSQVFFSLGVASRFFSTSPATYYCLKCDYSSPVFHQVAGHALENHAHNIAGILLVNNVFKEPKVQMVCLVCSSGMAVKQWASHSCRKISKVEDVNRDVATEFSPILKPMRKGQLPLAVPDSDVNSCSFESGSLKRHHDVVDQKFELVGSQQSTYYPCADKDHRSVGFCCSGEHTYDDVRVKQEICGMDTAEEEESTDDVPVHFSHDHQNEELARLTDSRKDPDPKNNILSYSSLSCVRMSSRSSVLQNLLTAPKETEFVPACFSLLQNLLKPHDAPKDKEDGKPLFSSRPSPPSQGKTGYSGSLACSASSSRPASTNAQYPCILEMLSRQELPIKQTTANSGDSSLNVSKTANDKDGSCMHNQPPGTQSVPGTCSRSLPISTQPSQSTVIMKYFPDRSATGKTSSMPSPERLSPVIPHPPALPYLPPLSPSPPLSLTAAPSSSLTPERQASPGPFTNLLRLLSKSSPHHNP